jgi:hypothetical protein
VAIAREVVKDVLQKCKDTPKDCGYDEDMHGKFTVVSIFVNIFN